MKKIILSFLFTFSLLNAGEMGLNGGGCTLAQDGAVQLQIKDKIYSNVSYKAAAKSGKNFREIFVGSSINAKDFTLSIVDYLPNKRMKGKPKTGLFMVEVTTPSISKSVTMTYIFDAGVISATGIFNKESIGFNSKVNYSLCNISIKK